MREFFVNADFDLSLRPHRSPGSADGRSRQAAEMPHHLLVLGVDGDTVLVDAAPDEDFLTALERAGLPRPAIRVLPEVTPGALFAPFGWNDEAVEINRSYERPAPHPPLDVVRRINGRRFAARLERELFDVDEVFGPFESPDEVDDHISGRPRTEGWLIKSEHGNAGLGHRRLRTPVLDPSDREVLRRLLAEDACVVLERWRQRVLDIATVTTVGEGRAAGELEVYEVVNTADGAYIGSIFDPRSETLEPWLPTVGEVAQRTARRLGEEGYFGPVSLDHFVWSHEGEQRLRPLADLNARLQVSAPILRLWRAWGRDRVLYWRLFAARKLRLPEDHRRLEAVLGDDAWDPARRRGVLATSPFDVAGRRLRRLGVLLAASSRAEVDALDRRFRQRFER